MQEVYEKPEVLATYTESQLVAEQNDLVADGTIWGLWAYR